MRSVLSCMVWNFKASSGEGLEDGSLAVVGDKMGGW